MIQMHLLNVQILWKMLTQYSILITFDDMIADIVDNKIFQAIIKELFIRCGKLNISLVFITQSYFCVPKDVRLNSTHHLIMKINNRRESQNIAFNNYADIDYQDFIKIYIECRKNHKCFDKRYYITIH